MEFFLHQFHSNMLSLSEAKQRSCAGGASYQNLKFIYLARRGTNTAALRDDEEEEETDETGETAELLRQNEARERTRNQQTQQDRVTRANVSPETRTLMRECLSSESTERQNLVERFLSGEIPSETQFVEELRGLERDEQLWGSIFNTQREIRRKIQALQWKGESYVELIPHQKKTFDSLIKDMRVLNAQDAAADRGMTQMLAGLTTANQQNPNPVLNKDAVREIYESSPTSPGFEATLNKYKERIEGAPNGKNIFRRILAFKKEEARIEAQFARLDSELTKIIRKNLSKVRMLAERENMLKTASRTIGITMKEGTTIEYNELDDIVITGRKRTAKIARIEFDTVTTYDKKGAAIIKVNGVPHITLSDGQKFTLGRFKKWVDAVDAVEKVQNLNEAETLLNLKAYGIKIEPGMMLAYPRRTRDREGNIHTTMQYVQIADVKNGRVLFSEPVPFLPGMQFLDPYDMRESLSLGEFVKWYRRYEVEKSVSLQELRINLLTHNELENKEFGIELKDNPPILVQPGETLMYPDESGDTFRIDNADDRGVSISTGEHFALPEFFYWVRHNHIRKAPEKISPEEAVKKQKTEEENLKFQAEEEAHRILESAEGEKYKIRVKQHLKDKQAGSLLDHVKQLWWTTQLLSLKDLWNMIMQVVEFVKRQHKRRSEGRFGLVGSRLPGIVGTEFERTQQSAENDEVHKYEEAMKQWGIPEVYRSLHETNNKDVAKATIMTLVHKGEMRWDDHEFWETLNRLTARYTLRGAELYIPSNHMPKGKNGEDMAIMACDELWGKGTGAEWYGENTSKYNSQKKNFEFKFKQLENDAKGTGGPAGECNRLLAQWRQGEYVNAQEYEEMIDAAIDNGKMSAEEKMFYIISGILARNGDDPPGKNPHGETLLHFDRIGELNSKYLNQFPMLDFFTQERVMDYTIWDSEKDEGKGGWGKKRKLKLSDYEKWVREYFYDDFLKGRPGAQFSRFMWEKMMMSDATRTRISKGIRNAENMDHDDAHLIIPATTPSEIDSICTGPSGQKKYFTNEGYMNGLAGFNHFILSLSYAIEESSNEQEREYKVDALRDGLNAFVRYDLILDSRLHKDKGTQYARLDERHFSRHPVVDGIPLQKHRNQLRNLIVEIGKEYGEDWSWLYDTPKTASLFIPAEREKQKKYEARVEALKEILAGKVMEDKGEKALTVIQRARGRDVGADNALRGIQSSKRPPQEEVNRMKARARELEAAAAHGGGH